MPELTYDVDVWVKDDAENLARLNRALERLSAEWGRIEAEWKPVAADWRWLRAQEVFCLTTEQGALDVFRDVRGLEGRYLECKGRGTRGQTAAGVQFTGLSDQDMLACQEALPAGERKERRIEGHSAGQRGMPMNSCALKREEERKREAAYDPVKRWHHIQQTITWAEANLPAHLRRNRPRTPKWLPVRPEI